MNKIKEFVSFFNSVGKLKKIKRKGTSFYGVKNPDSYAEHTFRVALMVYIFGKKRKIDIKRALKIAIIHNLPKIYTGDITPYDGLLPKNKKERKEIIEKWPPRCSVKEKQRLYKKKYKEEERSLKKLTSKLSEELKREIFHLWKEYVTGSTKEGRFVFQLGKLENLMEAHECWLKDESFPTQPWWQHSEEVIDDKELLRFTKEIEKKETKQKIEKSEMSSIFDFLIDVGKLKEMPRRGWVLNQIKDAESIADHVFRAILMAWILGKEKELNVERIIKMALMHDLCEVYAGDATPYDSLIPKDKRKLKKIMQTWPRFTKAQKNKQAAAKFKKELKGIEKLLKDLPLFLSEDIKNTWLSYEKKMTSEGKFFSQTDRLESFLQAMEYWKEFKKPPQKPWWDWAREFFDDKLLLQFITEMDKKF